MSKIENYKKKRINYQAKSNLINQDKNLAGILQMTANKSERFVQSNHVGFTDVSSGKGFLDYLNLQAHLSNKVLKNRSKGRGAHPTIYSSLLGIRNNCAIINPRATLQGLIRAFLALSFVLRKGGHVMIVNTNPELSSIVKRVSEQFSQKFKGDNTPTLQSPSYLIKNSDMLKTKNLKDLSIINTLQNVQKLHPKQGWEIKNLQLSFCYEKWVGGCLTNWKQISKSAITFATLAQRFEKQFRDKEINLPQYLKMKESFQGIVYYNDSLDTETALPHLRFSQKPDLLLLLQPDPTVLREARRLHIPVIVFTDSKTDLSTITYPIPSNTASPRFIYKCLSWIYKIQTLASRP